MRPNRKPDEVKYCLQCQVLLTRKRYNGVLEDNGRFHKRKYCNQVCMAKHQMKEQAQKSALLKRLMKFRKDKCDLCKTNQRLGVHHKNGNQADNSEDNLMTLCSPCHTKWHWEHGKVMPKRTNFYCKICGEPARKLDMCQKHYQRFRKYGNPLMTKKKIGSSYVVVQETLSTPNGLIPQELQQESVKGLIDLKPSETP